MSGPIGYPVRPLRVTWRVVLGGSVCGWPFGRFESIGIVTLLFGTCRRAVVYFVALRLRGYLVRIGG